MYRVLLDPSLTIRRTTSFTTNVLLDLSRNRVRWILTTIFAIPSGWLVYMFFAHGEGGLWPLVLGLPACFYVVMWAVTLFGFALVARRPYSVRFSPTELVEIFRDREVRRSWDWLVNVSESDTWVVMRLGVGRSKQVLTLPKRNEPGLPAMNGAVERFFELCAEHASPKIAARARARRSPSVR